MIDILTYVILAVLGAMFGSFVAASVWRVRAAQLESDKKQGLKYDKKEYSTLSKLLGKKLTKDRSQCLHCSKTLRWFELIPIVSWVVQRGKCRSCKKFIGWFEVASEVGLALFFTLSFALWPTALVAPLEIIHFVLWLTAGVVMAFLFAYDMKWFLLPDLAMFALIALGIGVTAVTAISSGDVMATLYSAAGSVAILGGLYAVLHFGSRGRWVGFGDVILGFGLGLLLADWRLALIALFMANFIGCLIVVPLMIAGKLKRNTHVPFGPLMIAGAVFAWFAGKAILNWYLSGMGLSF